MKTLSIKLPMERLLSDIYDGHSLPRYSVTDPHFGDQAQEGTKWCSSHFSLHAYADIHALLEIKLTFSDEHASKREPFFAYN